MLPYGNIINYVQLHMEFVASTSEGCCAWSTNPNMPSIIQDTETEKS